MEELFAFVAMLIVFFGLWFGLFWGPEWLKNRRERVKKTREEQEMKSIIEKWIKPGDYLLQRNRQYACVHYLNPAGSLKTLSIKEFLALNMPEEDLPKVWILRCGEGEEIRATDQGFLVYRQSGPWSIASFLEESSVYKTISMQLADATGQRMKVEVWSDHDGVEALMKKVLDLVSDPDNDSVAAHWIKTLQDQAPHILLSTKDAMGKSPNLEALRRFIERGPNQLYFEGNATII